MVSEVVKVLGLQESIHSQRDLALLAERGVPHSAVDSIVPKEYNFLINPLHPQFSDVKIVDLEPFTFDLRLKNKS